MSVDIEKRDEEDLRGHFSTMVGVTSAGMTSIHQLRSSRTTVRVAAIANAVNAAEAPLGFFLQVEF